MPESLLTILKFCFLALLYLFLARVVRVVVLELRAPKVAAVPPVQKAAAPLKVEKEKKGARGALHLRLLEPASRKGEMLGLDSEVTVGRGGGCTLVLADDTFVSTVHARLFSRGADLYVEDLGSRNGTFVNGKVIAGPTIVRRGDRLQFGQTSAEVVR